MTDEQLAIAAQQGNPAAARQLLETFETFLGFRCRRFYDEASSPDDLLQEARIGLMKAYKVFDPAANTSFRSFATLVVDRHLISYLKTARRAKHRQLTYAVRDGVNEDGEPIDMLELVEDPRGDVVQLLVDREDVAALVDVVTRQLTPLEREALIGIANGESHREIFDRIGRPSRARWRDGRVRPKTAENAHDRAVRKLRAAIEVDRRPLGAAA